MIPAARLFALVLIFGLSSSSVFSRQGEKFVSYNGGFRISLPASPSGQGANGVAGGPYYEWTRPEAKYRAGFYSIDGPMLTAPDGSFLYEKMLDHCCAIFWASGKKVGDREIRSGTIVGREYRFEWKSIRTVIRLIPFDERVYVLTAESPGPSDQGDPKIDQVLNSFELIDRAIVVAEMDRILKANTPSPLPQVPAVKRTTSDLDDEGLRSRVRSVLTYYAPVTAAGLEYKRRRRLLTEFDERGNLVKETVYDEFGDPQVVRVYGFIDQKRVVRIGSLIRYGDGAIGGIGMILPPGRKTDTRFDEFRTYRYIAGKLSEVRHYFSNGALKMRTRYRYRPGIVEIIDDWGQGSKADSRRFGVDKNGNRTALTIKQPGNSFEPEIRLKLQYDTVDDRGNWTKRTILKWYGFGSEGNFAKEEIEYRTITYWD